MTDAARHTRLLVVNPNTTQSMTQSIVEAARRYARPETEIVGLTAPWGAPSIEGYFEGFLSAAAVMQAVMTYPGPYDAVVMAGFGEPGREGVRELVDVPVMDITESAMLMACTLGYRFSVITTLERAIPSIEEVVCSLGLERRCASVRALGLAVLALEREPDLTKRRLAEEAEKALERDGAEVIVLGCGGLGGFDKVLQTQLNVPVIDGIVAAVKLAEACCEYGVQTSKHNAFQQPRPKPIQGWPFAAAAALAQDPERAR